MYIRPLVALLFTARTHTYIYIYIYRIFISKDTYIYIYIYITHTPRTGHLSQLMAFCDVATLETGAHLHVNIRRSRLAHGMLSGDYSPASAGEETTAITPRTFKALVGKGHSEFSTNKQQVTPALLDG